MPRYRRLRDLREDRDLKQQQVADHLGMHQTQYSRYERGVQPIPVAVLVELAKFYHTSTDYLLELTDDPHPPSNGKSRKK